jgi:hypothetical protein
MQYAVFWACALVLTCLCAGGEGALSCIVARDSGHRPGAPPPPPPPRVGGGGAPPRLADRTAADRAEAHPTHLNGFATCQGRRCNLTLPRAVQGCGREGGAGCEAAKGQQIPFRDNVGGQPSLRWPLRLLPERFHVSARPRHLHCRRKTTVCSPSTRRRTGLSTRACAFMHALPTQPRAQHAHASSTTQADGPACACRQQHSAHASSACTRRARLNAQHAELLRQVRLLSASTPWPSQQL